MAYAFIMNKIFLLSGAVVLIILVAIGFLLYKNSSSSKSMDMENEFMIPASLTPTHTMMEESDSLMKEDTMMKSSRYIPYSQMALNSASNTRRVLFFFANWCPTCIPADKNFEENISKIPDDVTLIRVNYNDSDTDQEEKDLAKKYGVTYQHTYVQIDKNGNEVTKWNGGQITELLSKVK